MIPTLKLKHHFLPLIYKGEKTTTIRKGRLDFLEECKELLFDCGYHGTAKVKINSLIYLRAKYLREIDAISDGFCSLDSLKKNLREFYPDLKEDSWVTIVYLRI